MLYVTTQVGVPIYIAEKIQIMTLRANQEKQTAMLGVEYEDGTRELLNMKAGQVLNSELMISRLGKHSIKLDEVLSGRKLNIGLQFPASVSINRWQIHWNLTNRKRSA